MRVRDAMTKQVEVVSSTATLTQAAQQMKRASVGCLPVCENDRLVGMLTDRDIVVRSTAEGHDPNRTTVRAAMTPEVFYCYADQDIAEAEALMDERAIRRLMVLDRHSRRLVGLLSVDDIAMARGQEARAAEILHRTAQPFGSEPAP